MTADEAEDGLSREARDEGKDDGDQRECLGDGKRENVDLRGSITGDVS